MRWEETWEGETGPTLGGLLSAVAVGYRAVLALRQTLYEWELLKSRRLPCRVISIGNVTLGGTGKTPLVELAVQTLRNSGVAAAIVSRGYRRRTRGTLVVADPDRIMADHTAAGDEPFLLARRLPGTPVVVGKNRYEAGRVCLERFRVGALVLDDAFQHRSLQKDLEIVTLSGTAPWGNGHLFPRGPLREPLSALRRAHLVVVTGPGNAESLLAIRETLKTHNSKGEVVTARYEPVECWEVWGRPPPGLEELRGLPVQAFAGIARPANFVQSLAELGVNVTGLRRFPDHHWYAPGEVEALASEARARGARALITTEKDAVRCLGLPPSPIPVWALAVRLILTDEHLTWERAFRRLVGHEPD